MIVEIGTWPVELDQEGQYAPNCWPEQSHFTGFVRSRALSAMVRDGPLEA